MGWASTTVDDVKAVRRELGGTFNDVVLACITTGFRELLLSRGESADRVVRTLVPVSVRPRNDRGWPSVTGRWRTRSRPCSPSSRCTRLTAPGRLRAVSRQMEGLKDSREAVAGEALTSLSGFAPPMLLALGRRLATKGSPTQQSTP